jgi:hypothetical protein
MFREKLPSCAINILAILGLIGLLLAIITPWYTVEQQPQGSTCIVRKAQHLFYDYTTCGTCNITQCITISPSGAGLMIHYSLLVQALTWACSIMAFVCLLIGGLVSWVPQFTALRWISRLMLLLALFFDALAFLAFLAINYAISEDEWERTGISCHDGICKSFVGHDVNGIHYWGPNAGWIGAVVASFFISVSVCISCCLSGRPDYDRISD